MSGMGKIVFEHDRSAKHQMPSESQIEAQCAKMDARIAEWASAHLASPGLVMARKGPDGWLRKLEQLKGLAAYDVNGDLCAAGTAVTASNAGSRFGEGPDTKQWAIELGEYNGGEGTHRDILTDEEVVKLPEDADQPLNDHLVQLRGGLPRLKRHIVERDPEAKPTGSKVGAAAVLRKLARERLEGVDGASPSPAAEGAAMAAVPPCTPAANRATTTGVSPMNTD